MPKRHGTPFRLSLPTFFLLVAGGFAHGAAGLDVPTGFTEDGHPYRGQPDAELTLVEYSDYLCPFCARYHSSTLPALVEKYVESGKMRMEFRHFPIAQLHPTAARGHEAAACTAAQGDAAGFWTFHHALFERQGQWNRLPDPDDFLSGLAAELGLDDDAWRRCFAERTEQPRVERDVAEGGALGFNGTPTFRMISKGKPDAPFTIVGAREAAYFVEIADALLAGVAPPEPPKRPEPELPSWARSESLAVDPARPGFTASGDPHHGDPDARLVIVEFTDYQCPACARHALDSQPLIERELIDTGKVRWVSKQLPLPEHPNAMAAAAAAECASNQGRFADMHRTLFREQEGWAPLDDPDPALIELAGTLELDLAEFTDCLGSRAALEHVLRDVYAATSITRATPAFVILDGTSGRTIRGTRTPNHFIEVVLKHLEDVVRSDDEKPDDRS